MYFRSEVINSYPKEERLDYLRKEIFNGSIALGRVKTIIRRIENTFAFVTLIDPLNTSNYYMLDGEPWDIYCNFKGLSEKVKKEIKEDDLICFIPILNDIERERDVIIHVDSRTVEILGNYNQLLNRFNLDIQQVDINEVIALGGPDSVKIWIREDFGKRMVELNQELINEIEDYKAQLETLKTEKEDIEMWIQDEFKKMEAEKKKLESLRLRLANLGITEFEKEEKKGGEVIESFTGTYIELYDYIDKYIRNNEKLRYSKDIIRRFLIALQCRELIVFSGPSGTGKTSIVKAFAKAFNGVAKIIAVKPNWTDSEDLLGFYNPIEKTYVSTPFLDAIVEAKKEENRDRIYLICLDEMNLAHIEYYFAEFLSKLEEDSRSPVIELYSEEIYKDTLKEIGQSITLMEEQTIGLTLQEMKRWCEENIDEYKVDIAALIKKIRFVERYPAKFTIPNNVRFIGTINVDQTTKSISPKVIDRSFVIELLKESKEGVYEKEIIDQQYVSIKSLEINDSDMEAKLLAYTHSNAKDLNSYLEQMNVQLNYRGEKHIGNYIEYAKCYRDHEGQCKFLESTILSDIVYMKMLPRFNTAIRSSEDRITLSWQAFRTRLEGVCSKDTLEKLYRMNEGVEKDSILSFWGVY